MYGATDDGSSDRSTPTVSRAASVGFEPPPQLNYRHSEADSFSYPVSPNVAGLPVPPSRPSIGPRSVSHPTLPAGTSSRPSRVSSTLHKVTSEFRKLTRESSPRDSEWSVFGELMENDKRYSRTPSSPLVGGGSSRRTPAHLNIGNLRNRPVVEIEDDAASDGPRIQSPVSDPHLGSHWPSDNTADVAHRDVVGSGLTTPGYDSDALSSTSSSNVGPPSEKSSWYSFARVLTLSPLARNILKCSIAYFIGSLFTYNGFLSELITRATINDSEKRYPSASGHMVATVAVYFNPAKTIGGMVEADKYCLMGLAFATFLSLGSMNTYWWLEVKPGWEWLADALVILWIGIGMSFVAWMKLWMAKPTFNTACSMTAIILFTVVVKEGGIETLLQVSLIVLVGSVVSNLVCFAIWPQSATIGLQTNMVKTLDSYSTLLKLLTSTFLLEEPIHHPSHEKIQKAVADHQASFTSLKKNLAEARSERLCGGPSGGDAFAGPGRNIGQPYDDAVDSLTRLAQHLNGLRSGTSLQYELAAAHKEGRVTIKKKNFSVGGSEGDARVDTSKGGTSNTNEDTINMLTAAASMFGDLVEELGPPMKSLSVSDCTDAIKRMREALENLKDPSSTTMQPHDFIEVVSHIERALYAFESTSNHAVLRLYRRSDVSGFTSRASTVSGVDDNMVASGGDNESVFLVYFFIFTLQEFANELVSLVDAMGRIYLMERARVERERWFTRVPKQLFSCLRARNKSQERPLARARKSSRMGLQRLSSYIKPDDRFHIASSFPKVRPHAPNTIQTPAWSSRSFTGKISWILWTIGGRMRERDFKYAVKAGMATAMLAAPAFFDATRPIFMEYRGEWALISFFVVMSPTIGATNFLGVNRVLGTLFGALTATAIYSAFPENAVVLSLFGFFYSIPCFYYIVAKPQYATTGRFVLLTYNLSCLYCYNVRRKDVSVTSIAFHRFTAVTVGVVWAAIVSRFWWPAEARRELSKALGEFCLNIGWLYTRLAAANAGSDDLLDVVDESESPSELTSLIPRRRNTQLNNSIEQFMAMEFHLQVKLIELQDLLKQTQHEPRLKGPFPIKLYRSILTSLQSTLDKLHSMRSVTTRAEWYTDVRRDFIVPVNRERREMVGNIILYFSVLASAFRLKAPLPPYLPPAEKARQQLVNAIRKLDVVKNRDIKGSRQLLFFAYALTMRGITQELDFLGRTSQDAFGVIGQSVESFEEMFRDEEYEARVV